MVVDTSSKSKSSNTEEIGEATISENLNGNIHNPDDGESSGGEEIANVHRYVINQKKISSSKLSILHTLHSKGWFKMKMRKQSCSTSLSTRSQQLL